MFRQLSLTRNPRFVSVLACIAVFFLFNSKHLHAHTSASSEVSQTVAVDLWYFQTHVRHRFRTEAMELILSYTAQQKPSLRLQPWTRPLTQQRAVSIMRNGQFPMFATLSEHRQFQLPELIRTESHLVAGLMGFRMLLSHKQNLEKLSGIQSIEQMRTKLRIGFGQHWRDYSVLQANDLTLVGTPHYSNLFPMLEADRFDAIPRGLNQIFIEEQYWQSRFPDIQVFEEYAWYYPYPIYLYMHKDYQWIMERINYGFFRAMQDGRMRSLFKKHFQEEIDWLEKKQPKLFVLKNPFLESEPNFHNLCWWAPRALIQQITAFPAEDCH
ncbi:hypothetical protein [uncultured Pseudoteredinibacter sp.]|uniref:hypothetical protein n=1 Tax=uncultured Pseudoteredinibacter sp. TaxID=1641701 RepID=UPI002618BE82|nr:hypothetical protein [uncultured Pseudoteredinibacter sp.]